MALRSYLGEEEQQREEGGGDTMKIKKSAVDVGK
jgi:hypothetical protein